MAHTLQRMVVEGREGKTREQQIARLKKWKKEALAAGASQVDIQEGRAGEYGGCWMVAVHHESAAALGASQDKYYKSPKKYDLAAGKWSKAPTLNIKSYAILHAMEDL